MPDPAVDARLPWQRAKKYLAMDGLEAPFQGASFIMLGVFWLYLPVLRKGYLWLAWGLFAFVFCFLGRRETLEWLKERIAYPRSGYVATPLPSVPTLAATSASRSSKTVQAHHFLELGLAVLWILALTWKGSWLFAVAAGVTALLFCWGRRNALPRFALTSLLGGTAVVVVLSLPRWPRLGVLMVVVGITSMAMRSKSAGPLSAPASITGRQRRRHPCLKQFPPCSRLGIAHGAIGNRTVSTLLLQGSPSCWQDWEVYGVTDSTALAI
jgi:hypothetical protein